MIHEYYKELQNNQNIRENLSLLRSECKEPTGKGNPAVSGGRRGTAHRTAGER